MKFEGIEVYHWSIGLESYYELIINPSSTRFNGEGIYQVVELYHVDINSPIKHHIYETDFGRDQMCDSIKNMTMEDFNDLNINHDFNNINTYNNFKSWLITKLTPLTKQRVHKINGIKDKIC